MQTGHQELEHVFHHESIDFDMQFGPGILRGPGLAILTREPWGQRNCARYTDPQEYPDPARGKEALRRLDHER